MVGPSDLRWYASMAVANSDELAGQARLAPTTGWVRFLRRGDPRSPADAEWHRENASMTDPEKQRDQPPSATVVRVYFGQVNK